MDLSAAAGELFPPFVRTAVAPCDGDHAALHPEEALAVARAVPKRRHEFLSGRWCAHRALKTLNLDRGPILVGPRREPQWPPGAVGSIAHAGGWSVAVAARSDDVRALGVDLEVLDPPLDEAVDRLVRTPAERARTPSAGHPLAPNAGKVVFSVKEAVYKCLFPLTRSYLEFTEVDVTLDYDGCTYVARARDSTYEGRFRVAGDYVVSGLWLS
jgi:4'-phosphopantetheinyl transferase EntD